MDLIIIILLYIILTIIFSKITKFTDVFKAQSIFSLISILYSLLSGKLLNLNFIQMGITFGKLKNGILSLIFLGIPFITIAFFSSKNAKKSIKYVFYKSKWQIIYIWILVGPIEELFFRGVIQSYLELKIQGTIFTISYATIISSFIFSFFHILNVKTKNESFKSFLKLFPSRFIAGMTLGYMFQVSKSILYPVIIHNLVDGITFENLRKKLLILYQY
ncbi:CPBP family intramembrane glutamic endopeptidase [Thermosipho melanesiensis]|nr:CPBP family intramembrane glutamic endopeptidase [Thermosipho melanesiensis]APT73624.1 CAAX protease [Thermosipho melanesiensis]